MALTINGNVWEDGRPLTVDGTQVSEVTANGTSVWKNNYPPTEPIGFTASTDLDGEIEFNWALPIDQGVPICSYEIMDGDTIVGTAEAGETTVTLAVATQLTTFLVRAKNTAGNEDSNTADGSSQDEAGNQTITSTQDFIKKRGWTSYNVQVLGGGGGGAGAKQSAGLGGKASTVTSQILILTESSIEAIIGVGGNGGNTTDGYNGGTSSIGSVSSIGGGGGAKTTNLDGTAGQASEWGAGGAYPKGTGGTGAGGGGSTWVVSGSGGNGGRGEIRIAWGGE